MSKRQDIISCVKAELTAAETKELLEDVTLAYIYKVRSDFMNRSGFKPEYKDQKRKEILKLYKMKNSVEDIAGQVGCSIQYVYRTLKNNHIKPNPKMLLMDKICNEQDEYYTPLYAIIPIAEQINPKSTIWCPFDTEKSLYVRYFRQKGHTVIATHLETRQDFFEIAPPTNCDYIISNPPYSIKEKVFERLFDLDIPFAMLVNTVGIFTAKSRFAMFRDNIELMVFQARVQYLISYEDTKVLKSPPFASGYLCYKMLEEKLVFAEIDRSKIGL